MTDIDRLINQFFQWVMILLFHLCDAYNILKCIVVFQTPLPSWQASTISQVDLTPRRRKPLSTINEGVRTDARHVRKLDGTQQYLKQLLEELGENA